MQETRGTAQRILVVEDDANFRDALVTLLTFEGHEVDACGSGARALSLLGAAPYDVLITDFVMSGMTGLELSVSALATFPKLRCLIMSGHARAAGSDAFEWIEKPIEIDALLRAISP